MAADCQTNQDTSSDSTGARLYQSIARALAADIATGRYPVGERMPAERELATRFRVSRPTIREAIIALEAQELIEVRLNSGAYVRQPPDANQPLRFGITPFEFIEARLLVESEAAALAATHIVDEEIEALGTLVDQMEHGDTSADIERADSEFRLVIARATRNSVMVSLFEDLWVLRSASPDCVILRAKAHSAGVSPNVVEHRAVVEALRTRDPSKARSAVKALLGSVLEQLLVTTEEQAVENARQAAASTRARYRRSVSL